MSSTPTTITVHNRAEAAAAIPVLLGFHPNESIVIVGIGNDAPSARLDLPGISHEALAEVLEPAVSARHWREGCLVVVFTEGNGLAAEILLTTASRWLPGVPVLDAFRVTAGECFGPWESAGASVVPMVTPDRPVAASRAELVPAIQEHIDPDELLSRAIAAWKEGNGAAAWIYLDRLEEVAGWPDPLPERALRLASLMRAAANPKTTDL